MIFEQAPLAGVYIVHIEQLADERGFFGRSWCQREFAARGLESALVQCSISYNRNRGTLRGMHYQAPPHEEVKLVRCTSGAIYDVVVDLRPGSATYRHWYGIELSAANHRALYIPAGFAHGFMTLSDEAEVFYQMSTPYHAESARGVRWNDPAFGIAWPDTPSMISERDRAYPDFAA